MAPGDAGRQVQLRRDGLARLADLGGVGVPAGVDHGARGRHGAVAAERLGQRLDELEALGLAQAAAAGDEHVGALDVDVGAALLAALDHRGLLGLGRELDLDVLDGRGARAGLLGLEGVEAADDDPDVRAEVDLGDRGVAQDRALGDELAVGHVDRGDLHRHAGAQARGEARADLEAEQAAAEERVAVAVVGDDLGHRVDHRLGQTLGRLGAVDLRGAVVAERAGELVGEVVAADDDRVALAAELGGQARALGHGAERVLVDGALVVQRVDQDVRHG